jgi:hypothetical protein
MGQQPKSAVEKALDLLGVLVDAGGGSIESVREILRKPGDTSVPPGLTGQLEDIKFRAIHGFFHCASKGVIFTELNRICEFYGRDLDQAYPAASPTFMKLARTYWTFKVVFNECHKDPSLCVRLLDAIDLNFAGLFFPMPGPFGPSSENRQMAMRALIGMSGADLDVEDYLRGNPYIQAEYAADLLRPPASPQPGMAVTGRSCSIGLNIQCPSCNGSVYVKEPTVNATYICPHCKGQLTKVHYLATRDTEVPLVASLLADELRDDMGSLMKLGIEVEKGKLAIKTGGTGLAGYEAITGHWLGALVAGGIALLGGGLVNNYARIKLQEMQQKWFGILCGLDYARLLCLVTTIRQKYPLLLPPFGDLFGDSDFHQLLAVREQLERSQNMLEATFRDCMAEDEKPNDPQTVQTVKREEPANQEDEKHEGEEVDGEAVTQWLDSHNDEVVAFLMDVVDYPESTLAARYERLAMSSKRGRELRVMMCYRGLIVEGVVEGRKSKRITITDDGVSALYDG